MLRPGLPRCQLRHGFVGARHAVPAKTWWKPDNTPTHQSIRNETTAKIRRKSRTEERYNHPNSTVTSAPRPIPNTLAAFPLFTHNSKYPPEPIIANGSLAVPDANVGNNFLISAFPARIVNFASGATSAGVSSPFKFVIKFPKLSSFSTTHLIEFPFTFGFGMPNRTKSSINSPKLAVCQFFESHAHNAVLKSVMNLAGGNGRAFDAIEL